LCRGAALTAVILWQGDGGDESGEQRRRSSSGKNKMNQLIFN